MLTCITCSKQKEEGSEEGARGTSTTKEAVKSLTAQIKNIALRVSGNTCSKPSSSNSRGGSHRPFPGFDSSSAPARNLTNSSHPRSRFDGGFSGCRTPGGQSISVAELVVEDDNEPNEWTTDAETGIQITFISIPEGGNDLKRIRFSRDMFDRWEAQRWWLENFDRIMELYNVQRLNRQPLDTPARSDNGGGSSYLMLGSAVESLTMAPSATIVYGRNFYNTSEAQGSSSRGLQEMDGGKYFNAGSSGYCIGETRGEVSSVDASRTTASSQDEAVASISNGSEVEAEWIEEDESGVYITIRQLTDGTRELRRVRFRREKFGEVHAKLWWEANKDRIQAQYL